LEMLISVLDWHGDTLSWAAVMKTVSNAGYNRIAKKLPTNILLFHKLENDKLLEQLKKQEKVTDVVLHVAVSYGTVCIHSVRI